MLHIPRQQSWGWPTRHQPHCCITHTHIRSFNDNHAVFACCVSCFLMSLQHCQATCCCSEPLCCIKACTLPQLENNAKFAGRICSKQFARSRHFSNIDVSSMQHLHTLHCNLRSFACMQCWLYFAASWLADKHCDSTACQQEVLWREKCAHHNSVCMCQMKQCVSRLIA